MKWIKEKKKIYQKVLKMQLISNRKKIALMEEKKIKNIRKKLQLRQTQKLNKKKVLCPPEFFFCCVEKNVLYVQTEKNVKKK